MARKRDYKREYDRRMARAEELGLSRSQARGHPRAGEASLSKLKTSGQLKEAPSTTLERFLRAARRVVSGESLTRAARAEHISPETIRRINAERQVFGKRYDQQGKFIGWAGGEYPRFPVFTEEGRVHDEVPFDEKTASLMGQYWNAVDDALRGDDTKLRSFRGVTVYDLLGTRYRLQADANAVRVMFDSMSDRERDDFERLFYYRAGFPHAA